MMYVAHMRFMPENVFLSLSDAAKIKMVSNQLFVSIGSEDDEGYPHVFEWLCNNCTDVFYLTTNEHKLNKGDAITKMWVYFYEELDLVAFKLRWM